jgi:periplasmic protein TonB
MENQKNNPTFNESNATLDDIIFKNKNHEYGAFELRKSYEKTMKRSFMFGSAIFISALLVSNIYANREPKEIYTFYDGGNDVILDNPKEEPPVVIPPKVEERVVDVPTTEFLPPIITTDVVEDETPPTQETLSTAPASDATNVGNPDDIGAPIEESTAKPEEIVNIKPAEDDREFVIVEQIAQYPGGMQAMSEFLSKNLKYPQAAMRSGVSGKVFLSFGIDKNGNIYDVTVTKGIGFNCDEEAVRVVKAMPNWSPGKQSGRAVKSRFNLPIVFMLE